MPLVWEVYGQGHVWDHNFHRIARHLDPLTRFYLSRIIPIYTHGYKELLTLLCEGQVVQLTKDIDEWQKQVCENLPSRTNNRGAEDRMTRDLRVLHRLKMNNLDYSRAIQWIIANDEVSDPLEETHMKHFWYRPLTSVGQKPCGVDGQHYGHLWIMLDMHTQHVLHNRTLAHPIDELALATQMLILCRTIQGEGSSYIYESRLTALGTSIYEFPRLRHWYGGRPNDKFVINYLKFISYKHTCCMVPKRKASYLPHTRIEPLAEASPPLEMKRHLLDIWVKAWHRQIHQVEAAPDCQVNHKMRRHLRATLNYHLKLVELKTGVGLEHVTGPHGSSVQPLIKDNNNKHNSRSPQVTTNPWCCTFSGPTSRNLFTGEHNWRPDTSQDIQELESQFKKLNVRGETPRTWIKTCLTHIPDRPANTYDRCFHRVPHTCGKCCEQAPYHELFFAHTEDAHQEEINYRRSWSPDSWFRYASRFNQLGEFLILGTS